MLRQGFQDEEQAVTEEEAQAVVKLWASRQPEAAALDNRPDARDLAEGLGIAPEEARALLREVRERRAAEDRARQEAERQRAEQEQQQAQQQREELEARIAEADLRARAAQAELSRLKVERQLADERQLQQLREMDRKHQSLPSVRSEEAELREQQNGETVANDRASALTVVAVIFMFIMLVITLSQHFPSTLPVRKWNPASVTLQEPLSSMPGAKIDPTLRYSAPTFSSTPPIKYRRMPDGTLKAVTDQDDQGRALHPMSSGAKASYPGQSIP